MGPLIPDDEFLTPLDDAEPAIPEDPADIITDESAASGEPEPAIPEGHMAVSRAELTRIGQRIEDDYRGARADHQARIARFARYLRYWRNMAETPRKGEELQFDVPLIQWQMFAAWAANVTAMFGDDAEINAEPTGPSDQRIVAKISRFVTWRVFKSLKLLNPFVVFFFNLLWCGRAFAYRPYERQTFKGLDLQTQQQGDLVWRDGPRWDPIHPDDLIVPAEDAQSIQDFSFVIRRYRVTPQQLLDGERQGLYFGIAERFGEILREYDSATTRSYDGDELRTQSDEAQGVTPDGSVASRNGLEVWEWYGRRRMPLSAEGDPDEFSTDRRAMDESELVVRYLPELHCVVGCQDLAVQYPHMRERRPISEASLVKDGTYWCPSFPEMLERIQKEASINHNLFTDAGRLMVGPIVFYEPAAGIKPQTLKLEPGTAVPTQNSAGLKVVSLAAGTNLQYCTVKEQTIFGYAERVTGRSDLNLGRTSGRPNEPQTATGQVALIEQGNIRASLDMLVLREDLSQILNELWMLDSYFAPRDLFFRVTEEEAGGAFETMHGGAYLTTEERYGKYDFTLKLATSAWSREARKQRQMQLYQVDLTNPLIVTNPKALWKVTAAAHKALGDDNFADIVPEPPDMDRSKHPREEWAMMQQGEDVEPHPLDDDKQHIVDHGRRLAELRGKPTSDLDAMRRMAEHIQQHFAQIEQKQALEVAARQMQERVVQSAEMMQGGGGAGMPAAGAPGPQAEPESASPYPSLPMLPEQMNGAPLTGGPEGMA